MADGGGGLKGAAQLFGEAVVKPTVDTLGQMVESGVNTALGKQPQDPTQKNNQNPQQNGAAPNPQQIQAEDNRKRKNMLQTIELMKQQEKRLRQQREQEAELKRREEQQEKVEVEQRDAFKKKEDNAAREQALLQARTRSERKNAGAG